MTTSGFGLGPAAEREEADGYLRRVDPEQLPHFSRALPALGAGDPERDFEAGLDLLVSGLIAAAGKTRPRR